MSGRVEGTLLHEKRAPQSRQGGQVAMKRPCIDGRDKIDARSIFRHIAAREASSLRACRAQAGEARPPSRTLTEGMGKWTPSTIPTSNYPPAAGRPRSTPSKRQRDDAPHQSHCFFFVSSLALTVTIVPKICRSPRPTRSSAYPVRANCVKGLASRCDLRVVLSSQKYAFDATARATARRRGGCVLDAAGADRRLIAAPIATGRPPCRRRWIYLL